MKFHVFANRVIFGKQKTHDDLSFNPLKYFYYMPNSPKKKMLIEWS